MEKIPAYGDLFTLEEFVQRVKMALFIPCDGTGYFATKTEFDRDSPVWPWTGRVPTWATHVVLTNSDRGGYAT